MATATTLSTVTRPLSSLFLGACDALPKVMPSARCSRGKVRDDDGRRKNIAQTGGRARMAAMTPPQMRPMIPKLIATKVRRCTCVPAVHTGCWSSNAHRRCRVSGTPRIVDRSAQPTSLTAGQPRPSAPRRQLVPCTSQNFARSSCSAARLALPASSLRTCLNMRNKMLRGSRGWDPGCSGMPNTCLRHGGTLPEG